MVKVELGCDAVGTPFQNPAKKIAPKKIPLEKNAPQRTQVFIS